MPERSDLNGEANSLSQSGCNMLPELQAESDFSRLSICGILLMNMPQQHRPRPVFLTLLNVMATRRKQRIL